ncbi:hypothetical protein P3T73_17790 [Kiritimatiellota bacterium B12222]|nr:hypothetical protein P3T73_17790 [Kiritimatiellota bacterium B12222]
MKILFPGLMATALTLFSFAEDADDTRALWKQSKDPILETMELESTRATLPESKWIGRDQKDLDREINDLLEEVLETMQVSGLTQARTAYNDFSHRIDQRRAEVRELREATLSADEDKSPLEFYKKTREDYLKEIEALEKDILNLQARQEEQIDLMMIAYEEMGIQLSEEQVRFYLTSISGSDMMDLSAVFNNIRLLNTQLEDLVKDSPDDPEAARRYYGIHVTLIRTMRYAHQQVLDRIDHLYLARIDDLEKQNEALIKETRELIRYSDKEHQPLLTSSLKTQQVTQEALILYRQHLQNVRAQVYEGLKALDQRYNVAMNAYQTISIAATLAAEMQSAVKDLSALKNMHLPALVPLNNEALQQKFSEITRELQGE